MSLHHCILLLGSNLGNIEENIDKAIKKIQKELGSIEKITKKVKTKPLGFVSSNDFCNIALILNTSLSPIQLLKNIKKIEREMGREKDSADTCGYTDRIIDIDIVTYDQIVFFNKILQIPHSEHMYNRDFSRRLLDELES